MTIHLSPDSQYSSAIVEIIGTVNDDLSIRELTFSDFGDNFGKDYLGSFRTFRSFLLPSYPVFFLCRPQTVQ